MAMESCLYAGQLRHRRFSPKGHAFSYPVFMAFLDVDGLPQLGKTSRFCSYNRWNWASYCERDHFGDASKPLRERLATDAERNGATIPDGRIFLLTHLRYLGYVFNPVSFFYFYDAGGNLRQMMAEVNNTFGESRNYWLTPPLEKANAAARRYVTDKRMHVSPFMGMKMQYDWIFTPPGEDLVAHMNVRQEGKAFFDATLQLERRDWSALPRVLATYPLMTMRVTVGIHWEALKLWCKGVPVFPQPAKAEPPSAAAEVTDDKRVTSISAEENVLS